MSSKHIRIRIWKKYAQALLNIAAEKQVLDIILKDLNKVLAIFNSTKTIENFLNSPLIDNKHKKDVLFYLLENTSFHLMTKHFLHVLTEHDRLNSFPGIVKEFQKLYGLYHEEIEASVEVATPCSPSQKKRITQFLEETFRRNVQVTYKIRSSILGGFILRAADYTLDMSLKTRLSLLEKHSQTITV